MANAGSVAEIWRFPVKSMQGERLGEAEFGAAGLTGDRAYALIDTATGKVASAKAARMFPGILGCAASFIEPPQPGAEAPPVRITFADGTSVTSDAPDAAGRLSAYFRRDVRLARSAPDDFTIEQYVPDIEGADGEGRRDVVVDARLGGAIFAQLGLPS
ncbi:MAG TPA: MOSC N-terminal beta barrel domain-containing protein, partial [Dehalococcoidia bacterium]|nr:MOSC N-terminal beta barrel domain-containing protein [Dehalococcoidia bacterium]